MNADPELREKNIFNLKEESIGRGSPVKRGWVLGVGGWGLGVGGWGLGVGGGGSGSGVGGWVDPPRQPLSFEPFNWLISEQL